MSVRRASVALLILTTARGALGQSATPLPSIEGTSSSWHLMFMGSIDAQYDGQSGVRGASQTGSISWGMFVASRDIGADHLQLSTMLSLDPIGVGGTGYPELLQSGETYAGRPLHDRQHPHDALMELGATYRRRLSDAVGVSVYVAPVGEPALGPVAFMMRPSAVDNPAAPIGHHWQDATHVSFGVLTATLATARWRLETSFFNGREPDDDRWNIDPIRLDSWAGRLTFSPDARWSTSASFGFLKSPDAAEPAVSEHRATVSVSHGVKLNAGRSWSTTLLWGANLREGETALSNSVLAESEIALDDRNAMFARVERVQKSAEDLALTGAPYSFAPDRWFNVAEYSVGYVRELRQWKSATLGLGAAGTVYVVPEALRAAYGSKTPLGLTLFLRIRPRGSAMGPMEGMGPM